MPATGGFILASNHLSYLDPITLGVASPRKLNFMAKKDLFSNHFFSGLISVLGAMPLERNRADLSALKGAVRCLREGAALVLFPQGSRINMNSSQVHPGVGFLAIKAGVPIIPACIQGTDIALPKGSRFIRPAKITVCFGEPIVLERRCEPDYLEIAQEVMSQIRILHADKK